MHRVLELKRSLLFNKDYPWTEPLVSIPSSFKAVTDYLGYFQLPLLENARVELFREASTAGTKTNRFQRITSIPDPRPPRRDRQKLEQYDLFLVCAQRGFLQKGHIILVATLDLNGYEDPWRDCGWAIVGRVWRSPSGQEVFCSSAWQLDIAKDLKDLFACVIGTNVPTERVMMSLRDVKLHESVSKAIMHALLGVEASHPTLKMNPAQNATRKSLNESQSVAIDLVLHCAERNGGVVLIQGPPGTGKTTTIVSLLIDFHRLHRHERVLVCAPTNIAMVEIAKKLVSKSLYPTVDIVILGSESKVSPHLLDNQKHYSLETRIRMIAVVLKKFSSFLLESSILISDEIVEDQKDSIMSRVSNECQRVLAELKRLGCCSIDAELPVYGLFQEAFAICLTAAAKFPFRAVNSFVLLVSKYIMFEDDKLTSLERASKDSKVFLGSLSEFFVDRAWVCFSTINGSMSFQLETTHFSLALIDEAAQAIEAETTCVLKNELKTLVLVGDTKQLQGTVFSEDCQAVGFATSLFARLERNGHPVQMLDTQYRMHPSIAGFSSSAFYQNRILNGPNVSSGKSWHSEFAILQFFEHRGSKAIINNSGSSQNQTECELICLQLFKFLACTNEKLEIGVICPFTAQKELLEQMVKGLPPNNSVITVNTIDGFQGQERDIVILSLTKAGSSGKFINDPCRMNVALTRAKHAMWVFGDEKAFLKQPGLWRVFGNYCKSNGSVGEFQPSPPQNAEIPQFLKRIRESAKSVVEATNVLQRKPYQIWRLISSDSVLKEIQKPKSSEAQLAFASVIDELRLGRLSCSRRPYKKAGIAGKLFFERRIDNSRSLVWTIEINNAEQVISLISICHHGSVNSLWQSFQDAFDRVTFDYAAACANVIYHHNNIAFPQSKLDSVVKTDSNSVLRTVSDSSKIFDLTSSITQLTDAGGDRIGRLSIPYMLDCFQEDAISVRQTAVIVGRGGTGKTSVLARKLLISHQSAVENDLSPKRQLFVTQSSMLVKRIETEFNSLLDTFHESSGLSKLIEEPQEIVLFQKAPKFMSFFTLLQNVDMIVGSPESRLFWTDNDETKFERLVLLHGSAKALRFKNSRITVKDSVVNFERFEHLYYPMASFNLQKSYSASFLFTQIMSIMKTVNLDGFKTVLTREEYQFLTNAAIAQKDRRLIYDFFMRYEVEKLKRCQMDVLDIMSNVLSRACTSTNLPIQDIVFIDEVQDLMPCQLYLFDYLRDEKTGIVCSGDQAQAITAGMDFRFSKLKAELHRKYGVPPTEIHLTLNYRTAKPIMNLSNQVLEVIRHFFPNELDSIPQEQSSSSSVSNKPRIFRDCELDGLQFLFRDSPNFSSEQAIIVLSTTEKEHLQKKIEVLGEGTRKLVPTILTVLEAKGLEFDDIVLYNLFANSDSVHRVLLNYLQGSSSVGPIPQFQNQQIAKHGFLCHELKQFYVAVTRAKKRLLVIDNSDARKSFIQVFGDCLEWTTVSNEKPYSTGLESTNKEWEDRGFEFKANNLLEEAFQAFERAGNTNEATHVKIDLLLKRYEIDKNLEGAKTAVALYLELGEIKKAADLRFQCKLFSEAAKLYRKLDNPARVVLCYSEARMFEQLFKALQLYTSVLGPLVCDLQYEHLAGQLSKENPLFFKAVDNIQSDNVALKVLEQSFAAPAFDKNKLVDAYVARNSLQRGLEFFIFSRPKDPIFELAVTMVSKCPHDWAMLRREFPALLVNGSGMVVMKEDTGKKVNWNNVTLRLFCSKRMNASFSFVDASVGMDPLSLYTCLESYNPKTDVVCGSLFFMSHGKCVTLDEACPPNSLKWEKLPELVHSTTSVLTITDQRLMTLVNQATSRVHRLLLGSRVRSTVSKPTFKFENGTDAPVSKMPMFLDFLETQVEKGTVDSSDLLKGYVYFGDLEKASLLALKCPPDLKLLGIKNDKFFLGQFRKQSLLAIKIYCVSQIVDIAIRLESIKEFEKPTDALGAVKQLPNNTECNAFIVNFCMKNSLVSEGLKFLLAEGRFRPANALLDRNQTPRYFEASIKLKTQLWTPIVDDVTSNFGFPAFKNAISAADYISVVEACSSSISREFSRDSEAVRAFFKDWSHRVRQIGGGFCAKPIGKDIITRVCNGLVFRIIGACLKRFSTTRIDAPIAFEVISKSVGVLRESERDHFAVVERVVALMNSGSSVDGSLFAKVMEDALMIEGTAISSLWELWNDIKLAKSHCSGWNETHMNRLEELLESREDDGF
ncbi:UNVERIFIED_CONTAM: hypothetical protein HDU68_005188 [Siphonaria sp. JEL0065]|nr:hypothetical protein HDU68_005188 [Siphonaria sp. JEL0065]